MDQWIRKKQIRAVILSLIFVGLLVVLAGGRGWGTDRSHPLTLRATGAPTVADWDTTVPTLAPTTTAAPAPPPRVVERPDRTPPRAGRARVATTAPPTTAAPPTQQSDGSYPSDCPGRKMSVGDAHRCWDKLIAKYFPSQQGKAFGVMYCESTGNSEAVGPRYVDKYGKVHYPKGLMQVMDASTDPDANMRNAASMQAESGWGPWECA